MKNIYSSFFICSFFVFFFFIFVPNALAALEDCPEKEAVKKSVIYRNDICRDKYNKIMPDPEDFRSALALCLSSIQKLSAGFSLDAFLPNLSDLLMAACKELDSEIQNKIDELLEESSTTEILFGNSVEFHVNIDYNSILSDLTDKIK